MLRIRIVLPPCGRATHINPKVRSLAATSIASIRTKVDVSTVLKSTSKLRLNSHELKDFEGEGGLSRKQDTRYREQLHEKVLPKEVLNAKKTGESKKQDEDKKVTQRTSSEEQKTPSSPKPKSKASKPEPVKRHGPKKKIASAKPKKSKPTRPKPAKTPTRKSWPAAARGIVTRGSGPSKQPVEAAVTLDPSNVPHLAHDLERVLFAPGVHFFKDPRTQHYNFTPFLEKIVSYEDFDFEKITPFVPASKDEVLLRQAIKSKKRFYSSTSSMTSALTHFYLFLNNYKKTPKTVRVNPRFPFPQFSRTVLDLPASVIVSPRGTDPDTKKTIYAVTSDKSSDTEILLSAMGHCLEAFLTTEENEFKKYLIDHSKPKGTGQDEANHEVNVYNYSCYGDFLMRSQLDCYDSRLPGNGTFDLKTRAVCAVRQDRSSDASKNTYQIWRQSGDYESFSKEYDDLIRTGALLKYAFQARIGQMDGIFVAYHNVNTFFGFQYLPLEEIDRVFYSHQTAQRYLAMDKIKRDDVTTADEDLPTQFAEAQFQASLDIWSSLMDRAISDMEKLGHKDKPFRLIMKQEGAGRTTRHGHEPRASELTVFAVPITKEQETELQNFSKKFKTSFKENITEEERRANLTDFQQQLHDLNMALIKDSPLLGYRVAVDHYLQGKLTRGQHVYPNGNAQDWHVKFRIYGSDNSEDPYLTERYEEVMKVVSGMLTSSMQPAGDQTEEPNTKPSMIDELRYYSRLGKLRQERWKKLRGEYLAKEKS